MLNHQEIRTRIEDAWRVQPTCEACGEPTTVIVRDDAVWVECPVVDRPRGRLERALRLDFTRPHTQRSIADLGAAAA